MHLKIIILVIYRIKLARYGFGTLFGIGPESFGKITINLICFRVKLIC